MTIKYTKEQLNKFDKDLLIELFLGMQGQMEELSRQTQALNDRMQLMMEQMVLFQKNRFGRSSEKMASLVDTFCIVEKGELWVKNMYIAEYFYGTYNNHNARRDRKLLLTKKELRKIEGAVRASGFTIVPTRLFINEKGLAKVVVAIARGKKEYDKRDSIRERDDRREMDRAFKR